MKNTRVMQILAYGPPSVLVSADMATSALAPGEVRIQTIAAAVNHTDLKIRAGIWPIRKAHPFPYVPGVEVVGRISEIGSSVSNWSVGQTVITLMQGLGGVSARRPGSYADFVTVDADALALVPDTVDPLAIASLGLGAVTAFEGIRRMGPVDGRRVLVTGAAGGVGSAAVSIARALGASVTGVVARPAQAQYVRDLGADEVIVLERDRPPSLASASVDAVLDSVGGALFKACVQALRERGTLVLVGAVGGGDVLLDAWQLIRPVTLTGYSTETLEGKDLRVAMARISDWLRTQSIRVPDYQVFPMQSAAEAHLLLERGGISGRVLLVP